MTKDWDHAKHGPVYRVEESTLNIPPMAAPCQACGYTHKSERCSDECEAKTPWSST